MEKDLHMGIVVMGSLAQLHLHGPSQAVATEVKDALDALHKQLGGDLPPVYEVHVICRRALCDVDEKGNKEHKFDQPNAPCRCGEMTIRDNPDGRGEGKHDWIIEPTVTN